MSLFEEEKYYAILRKHEQLVLSEPLGARTRLDIDSDLEEELLHGGNSDDDKMRSTGALPKRRSNPIREHYATLWVS